MASGAVRRSREITRADISMTTFVDTGCISIEYTDYSLQPRLALNFQFSPNFSIKIGLKARGHSRRRSCSEECLDRGSGSDEVLRRGYGR
jgi:hypothetical protein